MDVRRQCGFPEGVPPEFYVPAVRSTPAAARAGVLGLGGDQRGVREDVHDAELGARARLPRVQQVPEDRHGVDAFEIPFADLPITHGWDARTVGNARKVRFESGYSRYWASFASAGDAQSFQKATYLAWQRVMVRMGLDYN